MYSHHTAGRLASCHHQAASPRTQFSTFPGNSKGKTIRREREMAIMRHRVEFRMARLAARVRKRRRCPLWKRLRRFAWPLSKVNRSRLVGRPRTGPIRFSMLSYSLLRSSFRQLHRIRALLPMPLRRLFGIEACVLSFCWDRIMGRGRKPLILNILFPDRPSDGRIFWVLGHARIYVSLDRRYVT